MSRVVSKVTVKLKQKENEVTIDLEAANKVLAQIDRAELAQLGCDLTSIPSPTGQE